MTGGDGNTIPAYALNVSGYIQGSVSTNPVVTFGGINANNGTG